MLQASAVPDALEDNFSDYQHGQSSSSKSLKSSSQDDGLGFSAGTGRPPVGSSQTSSSISSIRSQPNEPRDTPQIISQDFGSTAPAKRHKTKRARSSKKAIRQHNSNGATKLTNGADEPALNTTANVPKAPVQILKRPTTEPKRSGFDLDPLHVPHLIDDVPRTLVEVVPEATPVQVGTGTDTDSYHAESDTETGMTTDEDGGLGTTSFNPMIFLTEIFASMYVF